MLQPVLDPERARDEQDQNALAKHRNFDAPHMLQRGDVGMHYSK